MQRKTHKSMKKTSKKKIPSKKVKCSGCEMKYGLSIHIQNALCRKYSSYHFSDLTSIDQMILNKPKTPYQLPKQHMEKFYKTVQRKHELPRLKQIYKLYKEVPRLFMPNIEQIINKCYHRKRLLEYFKIAKILGLKVESIKFSTFLLSLSKSHQNPENKNNYDKIIGQISEYDFSEQIQKQILETMQGKDKSLHSSKRLRIQIE